ncbi:glucan endo-1,3-beta-glucosidase 10-like [Zingiber officinale]|uniref:glucan endo-1,3-beta-glucosidase 10-like n=1 Tax=Zingiber officinale TaxID=94328 RepID=UPI001C4D4FCC|nr:glucan endo-1,3-beta-glucosidase 10-like [Zingiber officinale]
MPLTDQSRSALPWPFHFPASSDSSDPSSLPSIAMPLRSPNLLPSFLVSLLLIVLAVPSAATSAALVGINYGRVANNLPPPESVPHLLASVGVGRARLYDADPSVLHAFANTGVELVVGLPDRCLPSVAADPNEALAWVRTHIQAFHPATKIAAVTVGNEVLTGANSSALSGCLVPAMNNLHSALASLGLDREVIITSAHSLAVLATPSYPPSNAVFRPDLLTYVRPLLAFHAHTGAPLFVNAYPYFAYAEDPSGVALNYALLDPACPTFTDPATGLRYTNLLHAQIDAVYHAIFAAMSAKGSAVEVRISETGWPSAGDANETGASLANAERYSNNLMRLVAAQKGTPLVPGTPLRAYVFALFNENQKPGPSSERNYGLFKPDGTPVYNIAGLTPHQGGNSNSTAGLGGSGGGLDGESGYFSISASTTISPLHSILTAIAAAVTALRILS